MATPNCTTRSDDDSLDDALPNPAEKSEEEWLRLLQSAIESAADSVLITDAQLDSPGPRILYVNRAFAQMTGYDREDVLGRTPRILQGPKTDRAVLDRLRERLEQGLNFHGEAINYRKDGSEFVMAWDIEPIRDADGTITHWVSTQHDKTERRRLEYEVLEINARKLRKAREELNDLVGLLGTIAHESSVVSGALQQAGATGAQDALDLQQQTREALDRSMKLAAHLDPVELKASDLTMALLELAHATEQAYDVTCSFERRHPVLIADRSLASRLYNVAQEAVANAAAHSGADSVTIVLSANAGAAMLSIYDDGGGIDAAVARRREGPGLQAMERYARAIGGTLDIRSGVEGGTTVTCTFPRDH